jgi:hypothetical protein
METINMKDISMPETTRFKSFARQPQTGFCLKMRDQSQSSRNRLTNNQLKKPTRGAGVCINQRRIKKHANLTKQSHHVIAYQQLNVLTHPNLSQLKPLLSHFLAVLGYFRIIF